MNTVGRLHPRPEERGFRLEFSVSVVTPIFAMFLVFSSAIGVLVLGKEFTTRKVPGICFAMLAVYFISGA